MPNFHLYRNLIYTLSWHCKSSSTIQILLQMEQMMLDNLKYIIWAEKNLQV